MAATGNSAKVGAPSEMGAEEEHTGARLRPLGAEAGIDLDQVAPWGWGEVQGLEREREKGSKSRMSRASDLGS